MAKTLYKVLNDDGAARMGSGSWHLPKGKRPGKWMPPIEGGLVPCETGYHLCRPQDLREWLGPAIFTVECRGERIDCDDKIVVREARLLARVDTWNERTARLFACDCAERVLKSTDDPRCKTAVEVARRFADGKATSDELAAARDAARAAAWAAARDAAWAAARDAAGDAAWAAARAAAWAAAWDAARAAARDAAGDAARAAARDAAGDAAWGAARAAAWDAEKEWQTKRLLEYLTGQI